ncbi:MAG: pyridoxal 5'-phosphate synthase [Taibaiella sp.]|jgi:pyridoxamine 5'-phosphate oxidase
MNPFEIFRKWQREELAVSNMAIPKACCLSTIGLDGFPNARFLELKDVIDDKFIITGPTSSRKGEEIEASDKVAITCWWTATERQIRIQGRAIKIANELADEYFYKRSIESQIISKVSKQGLVIENIETLLTEIEDFKEHQKEAKIQRPKHWSGYAVAPVRIEFLTFSKTRFHNRQLFELTRDVWKESLLQP